MGLLTEAMKTLKEAEEQAWLNLSKKLLALGYLDKDLDTDFMNDKLAGDLNIEEMTLIGNLLHKGYSYEQIINKAREDAGYKKVTEGTEEKPEVGDEFVNKEGAKLRVVSVEPAQFKIINTFNGKEGDTLTVDNVGVIARILLDNGYKKVSLKEDVDPDEENKRDLIDAQVEFGTEVTREVVKGLLDSGAIDDYEYYSSLSDEEKEKLVDYWYKHYDDDLVENKEEITAGNIKQKAMELLPKEDIDVHEGDLYIKVSDASTELVNKMKNKNSGLLTKFKSEIDGEMWYEIPFANLGEDIEKPVSFDFGKDSNRITGVYFPDGKINYRIGYGYKASKSNNTTYDELPDETFPCTDLGRIKLYINSNIKNKEQISEAVDGIKGLNSNAKDVTSEFKNIKAFEGNFEKIRIIKDNHEYLIYKNDAKEYSDYINHSDSKDYIEGWLYGAVQAANKVIK